MHVHRSASGGAAALLLAAVLLAGLLPTHAGAAATATCDRRANTTLEKVLDCASAAGALEHLQALQAIADANDDPFYPGTRAAGTAGYTGSVDYIATTLEAAGWEVVLDPVEATFTFPSVLRQLTPVDATYVTGAFTGSGDGTVTGQVVAVDINLAGDRANSSGCEAVDFAGVDLTGPTDIVLVQRGTCNFGDKALNAETAGAEAVIIFNQGNTPDREGLIVANASTLTDGTTVAHGIPVVGASFADGVALAAPGATAFVQVVPQETRIDHNVIAELPGRTSDNVVMAGAHLDSVIAGPGIQDNGSGSAALLDLAQVLSKAKPENTLRFAWWAAEEQGLVGSRQYVDGLSEAERDRIAAYLNFDMIASPNHIFAVYDADESSFTAPVPVPDGSAAIEDLFERFYTWRGIPYEDSEFSGRSDYQAFILEDIPASGLFTGAEVPKTDAQAAIWGGLAGQAYDICYHLACDNLRADSDLHDQLAEDYELVGNVSLTALEVNVDAIAFAVLHLAHSTESVNGVRGRPVPGAASMGLPTEPAGPEGTVGALGGGGLEGDHDHDQAG